MKKEYMKHLKYNKFYKQVSVALTEQAYDAIGKLNTEYGIPKSFILREAIMEYLKNNRLID